MRDSCSEKPAWTSAAGGTSSGSLQKVQMRRTSRWATIRCTEVATRKGSMPMFIRRLIDDGASLVCRVESTRWPVMAALIATSAVSKSRISPTRMMFGSWRRKERSAAAKLRPICSRVWTWLIARAG